MKIVRYIHQIKSKVINKLMFCCALLLSACMLNAQTPFCGNGVIDVNATPTEECDLGTLNSDDIANNHGCKTDCTKHDEWECNETQAQYRQKVYEANELFKELLKFTDATLSDDYSNNDCATYNPANIAAINACFGYQEKLTRFSHLNAKITLDCDARSTEANATTTVTSFPYYTIPGTQELTGNFIVKCLKPSCPSNRDVPYGSTLPNLLELCGGGPSGNPDFTINTTPIISPSYGSLTINPDGTFTYIPLAFNQPTQYGHAFKFEVCNSSGNCSTGQIWITGVLN